ncbi:hypothetical protein BpHYR1_021929 [Brachionus plicatilis]|uniref:Uncharacterized protein n=1 Tax=Brachionus plicatilis TaxID=10195 RepID=A0A3M7RRS1_BRAPC|nr:hypothetical protein BpHYR1_021929 [Brachionus plicatilis]
MEWNKIIPYILNITRHNNFIIKNNYSRWWRITQFSVNLLRRTKFKRDCEFEYIINFKERGLTNELGGKKPIRYIKFRCIKIPIQNDRKDYFKNQIKIKQKAILLIISIASFELIDSGSVIVSTNSSSICTKHLVRKIKVSLNSDSLNRELTVKQIKIKYGQLFDKRTLENFKFGVDRAITKVPTGELNQIYKSVQNLVKIYGFLSISFEPNEDIEIIYVESRLCRLFPF